MIDTNYSLRVAYTSALTGMTGVGLYNQFAPSKPAEQQYIVMQSITNNDNSTSGSCDTVTSITLALHTFSDIVNSGLNADILARDVLNRVYPFPGFNLTIDGAQVVSTQITGDVVQNFKLIGGRNYISRMLTFQHYIFQTSDLS